MDTTNIYNFYLEGNSLNSCGKKFNLDSRTVKKILLKGNIKIRSRNEQLILENQKRTKKINHNYFKDLNYENSYYLGFLAADGCIRNNNRNNCNEIKIGLSATDKKFLQEFKEKIQTECKIQEYTTSNGFDVVRLSFSSKQIKDDLKKYSIVPNKTYLGITMENVPDEYKISFIKGYFDGDGSFSYNKSTNQCMIKIVSYTRGILEEINNYFNSEGNIYRRKRDNLYSLEFSTLPSLRIMKQFYNIDTPCLERKKNKYIETLKLREMNPRDRNSLK